MVIKFNKKFFITALFFSLLANNVFAFGPINEPVRQEMNSQISQGINSRAIFNTNENIGNIVATVIQAFLGLLGIIFIVLIILAGYNWMIARGDEEKVTKAKDTLRRAVIGLIIIVGAYAISYFVFSNLPWGGGGIQKGPIK